jgi:methionine aminotransferase
MKELESIVKDTGIIVLSDEVYEHIIFDKNSHQSVARFPVLAKNSFLVASFGKTFHNTGWKMGYCAAPEDLMSEFRKVHQFNVFSVNSIAQQTLAEYLKVVDVNSLGAFYQEKRDLFQNLLSKSRFNLLPCEGTYFQTADYSAISDENDVEFCKRLAVEFGVATIPISVFNSNEKDNKIIRFCFAKDEVTLTKAAELLCKI